MPPPPPSKFSRALWAIGVGLLVGTLSSFFLDQGHRSAIRTGDLPAFYTLAAIALSPDPHAMYTLEAQRAVQSSVWPQLGDGVLPAAYPPYVAWILQPLALLSPHTAKAAWSLFSLLLLFLAARAVQRINPALRGSVEALVLLAAFAPALLGTLGGQASSLSALLALVSFWLLAAPPTPKRSMALGLAVGAWLFKPHFALPVAALLIVRRRWAALACFGSVALALWGMAARILGPGWLAEWAPFARRFGHIDLLTNAFQMPGLLGAVSVVSGPAGLPTSIELALSLALGAVLLAALTALSRSREPRALLLGPFLIALLAPAVNFYDLSMVWAAALCFMAPALASHRMAVCGALVLAAGLSLLRAPELPGTMLLLNLLVGGWTAAQVLSLIRAPGAAAPQPTRCQAVDRGPGTSPA